METDTAGAGVAAGHDHGWRAARWWRASVPAALGVAILAPATGGDLLLRRNAQLALGLVLIAVTTILLVRAWRAEPVRVRRAWRRSVRPVLVPSLALAALLVVATVAGAITVVAPSSGHVLGAWRVLLADGGAQLLVVVAAVPLVLATRQRGADDARAWLAHRGLPTTLAERAASELRRVRTWRTVPAVAGALLGLAPGRAANLVRAVEGPGGETSFALHTAASITVFDPLVLGALGYALGAVVAELTRPALEQDVGGRLTTRSRRAYVTRAARWVPAGIATTLVAVTVAVAADDADTADGATPSSLVAIAAAVLGLPALLLGQRALLRRRQPGVDAHAVALDDTFRSSTVHALSAAASVVGLVLVTRLTTGLAAASAADLGGWHVLAAVVGGAAYATAFVVWSAWGSDHRGTRPSFPPATR